MHVRVLYPCVPFTPMWGKVMTTNTIPGESAAALLMCILTCFSSPCLESVRARVNLWVRVYDGDDDAGMAV